MYRCKRCEHKPFRSISALRKHQWKAHRSHHRGAPRGQDTQLLHMALLVQLEQLDRALQAVQERLQRG